MNSIMKPYYEEPTPEECFAELDSEELAEKMKVSLEEVKADMLDSELEITEQSTKEYLFGYPNINWDELISDYEEDTRIDEDTNRYYSKKSWY